MEKTRKTFKSLEILPDVQFKLGISTENGPWLEPGGFMYDDQAEQAAFDVEASCLVDGVDHKLSLYDLSPSGCMVEAPTAPLPQGRRLVVNFLKNLAVPARVVWERGGRVGLRFAAPLQSDLVQHLALRIAQRAADRYTFRDNFGRPITGLPTFPNVIASLRRHEPVPCTRDAH